MKNVNKEKLYKQKLEMNKLKSYVYTKPNTENIPSALILMIITGFSYVLNE